MAYVRCILCKSCVVSDAGYTWFVRVPEILESPGILICLFPVLESPGKRGVLFPSPGKYLENCDDQCRYWKSPGKSYLKKSANPGYINREHHFCTVYRKFFVVYIRRA